MKKAAFHSATGNDRAQVVKKGDGAISRVLCKNESEGWTVLEHEAIVLFYEERSFL